MRKIASVFSADAMGTATWALNTLIAKGKTTDRMVHMLGQAVGAYTDATHGMTLAAVSLPYYRMILPAGLAKFKRFAVNVWNVDPNGKSDRAVVEEGLDYAVADDTLRRPFDAPPLIVNWFFHEQVRRTAKKR